MKRERGFSLLELMTVMAICAVLAAIAVPNFMAWRTNLRLGAGAREILSAVQETRMRAIKDQTLAIITFNTIAGTYESFLDSDGNKKRSVNDPVVVSGKLPDDIRIINASFGPVGAENRFNERGMASFNGHVILAEPRGQCRRIIVNSSGNARIE